MDIEENPERQRRRAMMKSALEANRDAEDSIKLEQEMGNERWYYFNTDMRRYVTNLEYIAPGITEEVDRAIAYLRAQGHLTISSDVFGEADGLADSAVNLALTETREKAEGRRTVTGNALRIHVQDAYFETLDTEEGELVFANFSPIGGMAIENTEDPYYKSIMLYRLFKGVYDRLATPGIFVVQLWTLPHDVQQQFIHQLEEERISYTKLKNSGSLRGIIVRKSRKIESPAVEF